MFLLDSGPPCWCPSRWAPAWRLHTNLYKFGESVSPHIFHKKNCGDLNLGESLSISTFFLFPDSRLHPLNGFDFFILIYFEWRVTENQQFVWLPVCLLQLIVLLLLLIYKFYYIYVMCFLTPNHFLCLPLVNEHASGQLVSNFAKRLQLTLTCLVLA